MRKREKTSTLFKNKNISKIVSKHNNENSVRKYKYIVIKKKCNKVKKKKVIIKSLHKYNLKHKNVFNHKNFAVYNSNLIKFNKIKKKMFNLKYKHTDNIKKIIFKGINVKFSKLINNNSVKIDINVLNNINSNVFTLKPFLILYNFCYLSVIKNKNKDKLKYKAKNFFLKVKKQKKLLLLNIFFNKKNVLKPTVNHVRKQKNFSIKLKFIKFFLKKLILNNKIFKFIIHFKIKKSNKEKKKKLLKKKRKKKFFLKRKIFRFFLKFILVCKKILCINVFFKPLYNKSHANNNLKNKKIRRKKRKKKKRS